MLYFHIEALSNAGIEGDQVSETVAYASTWVSSSALTYAKNAFICKLIVGWSRTNVSLTGLPNRLEDYEFLKLITLQHGCYLQITLTI